MHFHSLDGSLGAICVDVLLSSLTATTLLAIIEGLQHTCVGTRLRQKEVILENTIIVIVGLVVSRKLLRPIILEVLHEAVLSIIHAMGRVLLGVRVVESSARSICIRAESTVVQVLEILVFLPADGSATSRELASLVRLVESVSVTVSRWLSAATDSSVVTTGGIGSHVRCTLIV